MTVTVEREGTSSSGAKRLVALLMLVASAGYVCRVSVTVVAPGIMHDFGLTQAQMGTVFSAFLVGYTLFQVPAGILADWVSARRIFLALCLGWSLFSVLTAAVGRDRFGFPLALTALWLIRGLFGVIAAPTYPTSARTLAVNVPSRFLARANSLVLASVGVGSALTPLLLAQVSVHHGWRIAMLIPAVIALLAGLLWFSFAPAQHTVNRSREVSESRDCAAVSRERPLRSSSFWFLFASYFLQGYLGYIFIFWFYLYLVQVRHFEVLNAAMVTALPWVATIVAIPIGGMISDLAVTHWGATWGRRSVPLFALGVAAIFLVIGARTPSASVAVAALTSCTVLVMCTEGPFWASMTQLSGKHSGIAGGTMNFGSNLGGMISPALTPWLAERIGWETALTATAFLGLLAALLWLGVRIDSSEDSIGSTEKAATTAT